MATDSIVISGTTEFDRDAKLVSSQNLTVTISGQIVLNDPILGYQELVSSAGGIVISDLSFVTTDPCLTVTAVQPTTTSFGALVSSDNTASECRENTSDNNQTFWYWIIVGTVGGICLLTLMVVAAGSITLYYGNHRYGWLFRAHLSDEPDGSSPI